jgi:2-polyprenyl-6-methoxyphenol hydroxylase-like FAD-dependent oxidoreductase
MTTDYDIITVGGGLGGSALAKVMAERGYRVLVVEREKQFKDRVRGEWMAPWGVLDSRKLGLYDTLIAAGAEDSPKFAARVGPAELPVRHFEEELEIKTPALAMYHPDMQEALIGAAAQAGAEVRRGVRVRNVNPGAPPTVEVESGNGTETVSARLVVGADGRNSMVRKWAGFESEEEQTGNILAGVLFDNAVNVTPEFARATFNPFMGQVAFIFPQGEGKARAYFGYRDNSGIQLKGDGDFQRFIDLCVQTGAPAELYEGVKQAGPIASFAGNDSWVEHPYRDGVALVGDAAQTSDQTWGQGLSITMRDIRLLRDELLASDDWEAAGHAYAEAANQAFDDVRTLEGWLTTIMMDQGAEATAMRMKAIPRMASDPEAIPDTHFSGPDVAPADEAARIRLFGED